MGSNKIGSYIVQYRENKRKAADEERRRRAEEIKRRPEIVDPSFEILGMTSPRTEPTYSEYSDHDLTKTASPPPTGEDWLFQTRRSSTAPQYQFDPYCEVTPKSSLSSNYSAASSAPSQPEYDMGWDTTPAVRPRPQSYLPPSASASSSISMTDLHRGTLYQSKRHTTQITSQERQEALPSYEKKDTQCDYRLESSLSRPFSIDDPLDFLSEPVGDSHLYRNTTRTMSSDRLYSIPEYRGTDTSGRHSDRSKHDR